MADTRSFRGSLCQEGARRLSGARFIERDLKRIFPSNADLTYTEKRLSGNQQAWITVTRASVVFTERTKVNEESHNLANFSKAFGNCCQFMWLHRTICWMRNHTV